MGERTTVKPYLSVKGAKEALVFYQRAFGADVTNRMSEEDGRIARPTRSGR
jgi:uncharacterized glyoxalase superfamily protein PhnB